MRHHSRTISGKQQIVVNSFAKSLEVIPRTIADNAGLDSIQVMNKLRQKHAHDGKYLYISYVFILSKLKERWFGVGINSADGICDAHEEFIWEPLIVKLNAIVAATEVFIKNFLL